MQKKNLESVFGTKVRMFIEIDKGSYVELKEDLYEGLQPIGRVYKIEEISQKEAV